MIQIDALTLDFPVLTSAQRSIRGLLKKSSSGGMISQSESGRMCVRALDALTLTIPNGERLGVLGHNGSGKTTLLRCLAGIYPPTGGGFTLQGQVASLLDLSLGLEPEASGLENILLRGIFMGIRPQDMRPRIDDIVAFSELGDFIHLPLKTYSSGMSVRLAFAIATSVHAEIVLMDEWLSVGDADFSAKAQQRLIEIIDKSSVLVIASHSPTLIENICTRAITLDQGKVVSNVELKPKRQILQRDQLAPTMPVVGLAASS